jgi:hypothetical protein
MASSFSLQTRPLDHRYDQGIKTVPLTRARNDDDRRIDENLETREMYSKYAVRVDNSYGVVQDYGAHETEARGIDISDPHSYRHSSYTRSVYPHGFTSNRRDNLYLSRNESHRFDTLLPENGTGDDDLQLMKEREIRYTNTTLPYGKEGYYQENRRSYANKSYISHEGIQGGGDNYHDEPMFHRNQRSSDVVQPGFQRVQYDVRQDVKPKSNTTDRTMIEVAPGEFLRLRTADETWRAIANDFYMPCECVVCEITLFCIQDALSVLCPKCLVVSPLEGAVYDEYDGGVGMGFTMESLAKWQEEIRTDSH